MAEYTINFTDPTVPSIPISPMVVNGPGDLQSRTTLRLFGENSVGWGESVNENFVRLLEHFMGATAPVNPVSGQLWADSRLFYRNSTTGIIYRYDIDPASATYHTWITITVISQATAPATPAMGTYWYNTSTGLLYYYQSAYDRAPAAWMLRGMDVAAGVPSAAPNMQLKMYDARVGTWKSINAAAVSSSAAAPSDGQPGSLRFDAITSTLFVWSGTAWIGFVNTGPPSFAGNVNMNNNSIINLANAVNPTDALNMQTGDGRYINVVGDSMAGSLTLSGNPTAPLHAAPKQYVESWASPAIHLHTLANITGAGTAAGRNVGTLSTDVPQVSYLLGKQTIWIPAGAMVPRKTAGAGSSTTETASNRVTIKSLDFDMGVDEHAQFMVRMPASWNEGSPTVSITWLHPAAATTFGVVWGVSAAPISFGDPLDTPFGPEQSLAQLGGVTDLIYMTAESGGISLVSALPGDLIVFQIARRVSHGSDTLAADARLLGVSIYYVTDTLTDA